MTKNPFKLYRMSQDVQRRWIRKHPFQYIALNAILLAAFIAYVEYKDRQEMRKLEKEIEIETPQQD
jgi:hypothetical protein